MDKQQFFLFFFAFGFLVPGMIARASANETAEMLELAEKASVPTRRSLSGCEPTNPIDNCWRCKPDWADNRQAMAQCVKGFGTGTTGGAAGEIYKVTDPSDDDVANPKEGTLRWGVTRQRPIWVTFEKDMSITLKHELVITSDTTIDGRGAKVEIANGAGLSLYQVSNVIIHGLHIHDIKETPGATIASGEGKPGPRAKADGDGIMCFGSSKIWIDHCSLSGGPDGLVDVTMGSTGVTISNCKFNDHDKVMLLGADDSHSEDQVMKVTVAYNKFSTGCTQRMPRCRWGFFQVVNNDYDKWGMYAIGGTSKPTILSQGNRYVAPDDPNKKLVTMRQPDIPEAEWKSWNWRSTGDLFENGAVFIDSGADPQLTPEQQAGMIAPEPAASVPTLTKDAGFLTCSPGAPC
ncbi:pectate lyase 4-like [Cynara cardunculus var. scolymus]|uniref:Pectate lyase n=1 Tax=Cynara cardunculus var. scolymus TaxID=59895 RepID=A0A103XSL4_CYNCS|nr:pectate lyase 4-like [Cynara cardunculus var. scolymus]KVH96125.1 AmbAllergen [Cynara cardunculus var. scolymus]